MDQPVEKIAVLMPMTREALADAPEIAEGVAVMIGGSGPRETVRYRRVWREGYWQALEDIRRERLVLRDGHFVVGHAATTTR